MIAALLVLLIGSVDRWLGSGRFDSILGLSVRPLAHLLTQQSCAHTIPKYDSALFFLYTRSA